jgi:hypothetical protein
MKFQFILEREREERMTLFDIGWNTKENVKKRIAMSHIYIYM